MREFYAILFKRGFLSDIVAKQDPVLLFEALESPKKEAEAEISEGLGWFYGE